MTPEQLEKKLDNQAWSYAKKESAKQVNPKEFNDFLLHHSFTGEDLYNAYKAGAKMMFELMYK